MDDSQREDRSEEPTITFDNGAALTKAEYDECVRRQLA